MRTFYLNTIERTCLDSLEADALLLSIGSTSRPPQGLAGLLDWRLNGFISRMMLSGDFKGEPEEKVLMDTFGRVGVKKVFMFGWDETCFRSQRALSEAIQERLDTAIKAGCEDIAIEVPYPRVSLEMMGSWEKAILDVLKKADKVSDFYLFVEPQFRDLLKQTIESEKISIVEGG